jgi:hypothetical protein
VISRVTPTRHRGLAPSVWAGGPNPDPLGLGPAPANAARSAPSAVPEITQFGRHGVTEHF